MIYHMSGGQKVKIAIMGQVYTIEGDAPAEYIMKVAQYVNQKIEEISKNVVNATPLQIAILAALNITDELFQLQESGSVSNEIIEKANMLIAMLDEGLIGETLLVNAKQKHIPYS